MPHNLIQINSGAPKIPSKSYYRKTIGLYLGIRRGGGGEGGGQKMLVPNKNNFVRYIFINLAVDVEKYKRKKHLGK